MMTQSAQSLLAWVEFSTPEPERPVAAPTWAGRMTHSAASRLARVEFSTPDPEPRATAPIARSLTCLRAWATHPLRTGSIIPSSRALCRRVVQAAWPASDKVVVELGAGAGVLARALLQAGLAPDRLVLVEIEPTIAAHLRARFPGVTVIEGDARELPALLPGRFRGRIGSVVCGIPLVLHPRAEQRRFIAAIRAVAPGLGFIHYSSWVTSPLRARRLGLAAAREAWTPLNLPPASVWRYSMA